MTIRALTPDEQRNAIADLVTAYADTGEPMPMWLHAQAVGAGIDAQAILDDTQETNDDYV